MTQNFTIDSVFHGQVPRRTKYFLLISNNFYLIILIPILALILSLNTTPLISIGLGLISTFFLIAFWKIQYINLTYRDENHPHHKSWDWFSALLAHFAPTIRALSAWQVSLVGWFVANIPIALVAIPELINSSIKVTPRLDFDLYWLAYIPVLMWISYRSRDHATEWFGFFWIISALSYAVCFFLIYGSPTLELNIHLLTLLGWFLFLSFVIHYLFRRVASFRAQSELLQTVTERLRNHRKYTEAFDFHPIENSPDLNLMEIATQIGKTLLYDRVFILVRDRGTDMLYMKGRYGINSPWPASGWSIYEKYSITGWVAVNMKEHLCHDTQKCDLFFNPSQAYPCMSEATVPIIVDQECVGVIDVESDHRSAFHASDIRLIWQIANSIGAALSHERHVSSEVDKTHELIMQASEILSESKNLDEALQKVAYNLREIFKADLVVLYKHAVATCVPLPGLIVEGKPLHPDILGHSIRKDSRVTELVRRSEPLYISPHADEDLFLLGPNNGEYIEEDIKRYGSTTRFVKREGIKSMIYLRLGVGDDIVGSLFLNYRKRMGFPRRMIESLSAIVKVVSMGLILKRQLERAIGPLAGTTPLAHSTAEAAFESVTRDFDELNLENMDGDLVDEKFVSQVLNYRGKLDNLRMEWTNLILVEQMHLNSSSMIEPISHLEMKLHSMFPNVVFEWNSMQFLDIPTNEFGEVVYKIVAEGVSNALVHAHAKSIKLKCSIENDIMKINISNDGKPIDSELVVNINGLVNRPYLMDGSEKQTGMISILLDARRWFGAEWSFVSGHENGTDLEVKMPLGIYGDFEDLYDEN